MCVCVCVYVYVCGNFCLRLNVYMCVKMYVCVCLLVWFGFFV